MIKGEKGFWDGGRGRVKRKGQLGSQMKIFPFLFLLLIIGGGIVGGVYLFFGGEYEFREVDAEALNYRVKKCILENEIDWAGGEFYGKCRISKEALEGNDLILKVCKDVEDCVLGEGLVSVGGNFQACRLEGARENDNFPKCVEKEFVKNGERYFVISGSNQRIKRRGVGI